MKNRVITLVVLLMVSLLSWNSIILDCHAYDPNYEAQTWEELREWLLNNGAVRGGGGTHTEVSICPGQVTPNSNSSLTQSNTTQNAQNITKPVQPAHTHAYIETIITEPTCIKEGTKTFTCSCGEKYTESIEMVEHTYDKSIITQEATCTVNGKRLISCSVCNDTYEEDIEALGHDKGEWVVSKSATCMEKGEEVVNCIRCEEILESRETEALGHEQGEMAITQEATLFSKGLKETKCLTCGEVLAAEEIPINMNTWYIIIGACLVVIGITTICVVRKKKRNRKQAPISK